MKHILTILTLYLIFISSNAQLNMSTTHAYTDVFKHKFGQTVIRHFDIDNTYYLITVSDNRFADPHIIYLGKGKKSAILSLKDLKQLSKNCPKSGVAIKSINDKTIMIYPHFGSTLRIQTKHSAGYLDFNFDKAIEKLINYEF